MTLRVFQMREQVSTMARTTDVVFSSGWGTKVGAVKGTDTEKLAEFGKQPV